MKRLIIALILTTGVLLQTSCEKEEREPNIQTFDIVFPAEGGSKYIETEAVYYIQSMSWYGIWLDLRVDNRGLDITVEKNISTEPRSQKIEIEYGENRDIEIYNIKQDGSAASE